jgi:hypothetical protein
MGDQEHFFMALYEQGEIVDPARDPRFAPVLELSSMLRNPASTTLVFRREEDAKTFLDLLTNLM